MNLQENIERIKQLMEQDDWTRKAASGPQKCGKDAQWNCDNNSREDRQWDREVKRQEKVDRKQSEQEYKDYINPKLDRLGYKVDKNDFNSQYKSFVSSNPEFEKIQSNLNSAQRFGILYKEISALKDPNYYLTRKFNKMFNREGGISSMKEFYDIIMRMGGFDEYLKKWNLGFPQQK